MEESLARHTGGNFVFASLSLLLTLRSQVYDPQPAYRAPQYPAPPDSRVRPEYSTAPGPQPFGWNASSYEQPAYFPTQAAGYPPASESVYPAQPSQYVDPATFAQMQQTQALYSQAYAQAAYGPQGPTPYPAQAQAQPMQPEQSTTSPLQPQLQTLPQAAQNQAQTVQQPTVAQQQTGPPYVYDPNGTYPDPNVQAWAKYYAQNGKDLAGAVYFISIPGLTDGTAQPSASSTDTAQQTQAAQATQQHQPSSEAVGYFNQPSATSGAPQSNLSALQTSLPLNGYGAGPTSPMAATSGGPHASPPVSPNQPAQMSSYQQHLTSGSPPPNSHAIPGIAPLQVSHESVSHLQLPAANPYGDPGSLASPHNPDGSMGGGHEATAESNVAGYPQYYSLQTQFAGMTVGEDRDLAFTGKQHTNQAAQGVGAPA
jgi:signal transducing adaptor molecule